MTIPLTVPNLCGNEEKYLRECIATNFVSSVGPFVEKFENLCASASGAKFAVATNTGTSGLHTALLSVGVVPGDLVILPSWTFIASANSISYCGANPWLFDVSANSWTLDPKQVQKYLSEQTEKKNGNLIHKPTGRRIGAMMPVHMLGLPADMDALVAIAGEYELPIVADGAAAIGATYHGKPSGNIGADLTVYSFNGNKTLTSGGGGCIVGNDDKLIASARHLASTARIGNAYDHDRVGFNYRMTNIQAAVGCAQLEMVDKLVGAKKRIAQTYNSALAGHNNIEIFPVAPWGESACWMSGIVLPDAQAVTQMLGALNKQGIEARSFWKPVHLQAPYKNIPITEINICESLWSRVLLLPCSTNLSSNDQEIVISAIKNL